MIAILLVVSFIIVAVIIFLCVITTSKAYKFKHTVDSIDPLPNQNQDGKSRTSTQAH
ncbi:large-conductance mechanosensitive channel [Cytobacillus eiseniae]|uniref:Large-conductance mechanosensitive channel n=1 Tax=Cytobacillus eiseniae TaxID=762947 RepID=A0ABS4RJI8_9BACI|nr:YtzI protein [Cytobacillus eiseniae]MBP2243036.1 large-conductance mechanosensitive channel [Cytobacillus eiseniae]